MEDFRVVIEKGLVHRQHLPTLKRVAIENGITLYDQMPVMELCEKIATQHGMVLLAEDVEAIKNKPWNTLKKYKRNPVSHPPTILSEEELRERWNKLEWDQDDFYPKLMDFQRQLQRYRKKTLL